MVQPRGKIEICNDESEVLVNQQVFWLNVPVDHSDGLVQVLKPVHELLKKVAHQGLRQVVVDLDQPVELAIFGKVHHVVADRGLAFDHDWLLPLL